VCIIAVITVWTLISGVGKTAAAPSSNAASTAKKASAGWQSIGKQGDALGDFQQPRGITCMGDGSIVVVDRAARVQHFDPDGKPLGVWSMREHAMGNPKGLCALPDGNILVCDTHYGRVLEMTLTGDIVKIWGNPGHEPGHFIHPLSAIADPKRGVAYIVEYGFADEGEYNDRVQKFKLDGTFIKMWGSNGSEPGQLQRPSGIALDSDGNVYVADSCNHRIQKFDPEGKLLLIFGEMGVEPGKLRYPYDIACGPGDLLYVAEFNNHRVSVFDRDGHFQKSYGGPGDKTGEFHSPWSLTVDGKRNRLLVSDTGNFRLQVLELN
jgi:DNA-binding beta-propeller fold protein YncE